MSQLVIKIVTDAVVVEAVSKWKGQVQV